MGNQYTWNNGCLGDAFVQERLDRACASAEWRELFPHAKVSHLQASYSDHIPILINITGPDQRVRRKNTPQRFEEKWASHAECENVIRQAWETGACPRSPMYRLFEKIKRCRVALVEWSRNTFSNKKSELQVKQAALEELSAMNDPNKVPEIRELKNSINTLLHQDELFWRQRSRSIWLPAGDKNTKYFHQRASQRRRKNRIHGVEDQNGEWCTCERCIAIVAEQYFQGLFTTANPVNLETVLDSVEKVVTRTMNKSLLEPYTPEEVRQAFFQMHSSKSLGPNGMSPFFFQKYWHIVGHDVSKAVISVLHSCHMLHKMNYTHIVLIPKKQDPKTMADYKPISLGNVVSRILSKVLANRLKIVLRSVISDAQSAFVLGRLITDNTTVAYELLHRMRNKRKGKKGQMTIKLNISKAYDRVE
ncbi:hypothetical protein SO802_008041 [Lithocarpus litseifolius]|uniref:Reverse transcriptase domain-containing protein n=1 Tax=Lithocarpus litseifolius TaxID=425828 RepID=A0AAW2D8C6_9ROSI